MKRYLRAARRFLDRRIVRNKDYLFLWNDNDSGEVVSLDCETTGLDPWKDDIISIAAIRVKDRRILTSERFEVLVRPTERMGADVIKVHRLREADVAAARPMTEVLPELLRFIGPRPLIGYYIDFDIAMIDRYLLEFLGVNLPNPRIEVSELYYAQKYGKAPPGSTIDLRFARIMEDLNLPERPEHDAFNDALMTAMMYVKLIDYRERAVALKRDGIGQGGTHAQAAMVG